MRADRFAASMAMIAGCVCRRSGAELREIGPFEGEMSEGFESVRNAHSIVKYGRVTVASFAAVLGPLAGIAASLAGTLPARGGDVPFTEHVISTTAGGAFSVFATDLDGDGDTDVLSASPSDNKIAWYESDGGSPPSFTEHVISTTAYMAESVFADDGSLFAQTDLDGDGDTDVLSSSFNDDKIAWYENDGGSPPSFTERVISTTANGAWSAFATDLDGDGDTDVLSASLIDNKIAWYESDGGSPPSFTTRVISTAAAGARFVFATDVNGDGDTDVLSASLYDDKIAWYESDGGSPPAFTERVISTAADEAWSVFATDMDGDGDTDVLSASNADDKIAWYESDGGSPPTFTERVISTAANGAASVFATDMDGDGDTDVLSASWIDNKIAWYENMSCPSTCGDGVLCLQTEVCDDGYMDTCGSCNADCTGPGAGATCGDGEVCPEIEECDDGNTENCDACDSECVAEECGNGKTQCNEDCDDGDTDACGLCNADCTGPGMAPSAPPEAERLSEAGPVNAKNRYVSILAGDAGASQAIRVRFVDLPPPFDVWNFANLGTEFFVGVPFKLCENSGQARVPEPDNPPDFGCGPASGLSRKWFWAGPLVCDKGNAHFMDWHGECDGGTCVGGLLEGDSCATDEDCVDVLHLFHEGLVPDGVYDVQVVDADVLQAEGCYSVLLRFTQAKWGDVCGPGPGGACSSVSDGTVDVQNDVLGVLDKFSNVNDLQKARTDLEPGDFDQNNGPDFKVNVANDVLFALEAFQSFPYPFAPGKPCDPG